MPLSEDYPDYPIGGPDASPAILWVEFQHNLVPDDATIFGVTVEFDWAVETGTGSLTAPGSGKVYSMRCQWSKDGITDSGTSKRTSGTTTKGFTSVVLGGEEDLWGTTWTPEELNASALRLKIWRPVDANEQTTLPRLVDNVRVRIYYGLP